MQDTFVDHLRVAVSITLVIVTVLAFLFCAWGLAYKFGLNQFPLLRELMGERKEPKMTKEEEAAEIEATKKMFYQHPRRRPVSISSLRQTASAGN
mmetsp:Transcript_25582/g.60852  ORF Transcript_25582/g.60852 Transcript_25582/m.60852 type:complete len:95 (-) Transcript_25582:228-512(-)